MKSSSQLDAVDLGGVTVPLYFGDPGEEYRAAREAAGIAERLDLGHVRLSGRDPVKMVQGLITNDLAGAAPDRSVYGAMLTPKGRVIAELRARTTQGEAGAEVLLELPREVLGAATEHLRRSVPPLYARWKDVSEMVTTLGVYGPRARDLLERVLGVPVPALEEDQRAEITHDGRAVQLVGVRQFGGEDGFDLTLEAEAAGPLLQLLLEAGGEMGARRVGFGTLETLRVEAGRPRGGRELTEETIPTEAFESTGLMERGISFTKGCYTGQEVIVRIAHRGHVNRHLRGLILPGGGADAAAGARLYAPESGREVGWITTVAHSPRRGAIALGFVRREIEPGAEVRVGSPEGEAARVSELPFPTEVRGG